MVLSFVPAYASLPYYTIDEDVTFIVEVEGEPLLASMQAYELSESAETEAKLLENQAKVMSLVNDTVDEDIQKGFVYTALFNGFSMDGKRSQLEEIKALPGVKNVYISGVIRLVEPTMDNADELTYINKAYDIGYNGEGMAIAVIDAGCDTSHEFFSTEPSNPRFSKDDIDNIIKAESFNSGISSANQVYKSAKIPYAYNYISKSSDTYFSTQKHGTHVSGIAVGKNGTAPDGSKFSGAAPEAQLLFMGCGDSKGFLHDDAVFAGINDAALLGADVINMSFSADYADSNAQPAYNTIISNAHSAGISLVGAAGNSSRGYLENTPLTINPDYSALGIPSGLGEVTSVASADNTSRHVEYWALLTPDDTEYKAYVAHSSSLLTSIFTDDEYIEYVDCGLGNESDFEGKELTGKIALVKRGGITFVEKSDNAASAGAVGIIIYNTTNDTFACADALSLPSATVTLKTGEALAEYGDKKIKYDGTKDGTEAVETAGKISSFSSWGVDSTLQLKPEITAPGAYIYSSVPDNKYGSASGTSMASPYMAGITALGLQYYKTNPFADSFNGLEGADKVMLIENLAMNSADIIRQESGVAYSPRLQGAGLVNVENMLKSRVLLTGDSGKAKLSLGDKLTDTFEINFKITNITDSEITFDKISAEVMTDGFNKGADGYEVGDTVSLTFVSDDMPEKITVAPGEEYEFSATVQLDEEAIKENSKIFTNGFFIDGFVILDTSDSSAKASLPFTGFYGDWGAADIFDSTIYDEGGSSLIDSSTTSETGTFITARFDNVYVTIGRNPYAPEIVDKKYIAYSANGGYDFTLVTTNYRATDSREYSIADSEDKTVFTESAEKVMSKFETTAYYYPQDSMNDLKEGSYTARIKANTAGTEGSYDVLEIPFTVDNTNPDILSAVYDEEKGTITVTAKDNHYLCAVYASYILEDESEGFAVEAVYNDDTDLKDGIVTKILDVSDAADIGSIVIGCMDYAYNENLYDFDYICKKVGVKIENFVRTEGTTTAKFSLRNNTDSEINTQLIVAFYDKDKNLITANTKTATLAASSEATVNYAMLADTLNATEIRLFIWENDSVNPVDEAKIFEIE